MKKFEIAKFLSTFFYVGLSKRCPGTVGSVATLPFWLLINNYLSKLHLNNVAYLCILLEIILFLFIIGIITIKIYINETKKDDPSEVVIDEVVGQMIAYTISLLPVIFYQNFELKTCIFIPLLITPLILFRFFDILKPNLVGYIDKNMVNEYGVMLDDVVAGVYAGLTNLLVFFIYFKLI